MTTHITKKFNIIIPTIKLDKNLINCLNQCLLLDYKSFFITIITEDNNNLKAIHELNKTDIDIFVIKSDLKNMTAKRNAGALKYESQYLAFIDSDAYPKKDWLSNAEEELEDQKIIILGGPSGLPFQNSNYSQKIVNLAKRSFFCTGTNSKNKYSRETYFTNEIESCNMFIERKNFLEVGGMDSNLYLADDSEFCNRISCFYGKNKIKYSGKTIVLHKDRTVMKFFMQRFSFGTSLFTTLKFIRFYLKFMALIPLLFFMTALLIFITYSHLFYNLVFMYLIFCLIIFLLIIIELKKFSNNLIDLLYVCIVIFFANIFFIFGNLFQLLCLNKFFQKKIYVKSK
jgi:GT2 family glycosyltransferase